MIAAFDGVALEPAHRQRREPVRARICQRRHRAGSGAVEDDKFAQDTPLFEIAGNVARPGRGIPGIPDEFVHAACSNHAGSDM